jgi:hypothetical protein
VPGLKSTAGTACLLADPKQPPLHTEATDSGLVIAVPRSAPDAISSTIVLRLSGSPDIQPAILSQSRDGSITLPASEARLHGSTFQYESSGPLNNIGYWTTPEDWVDWEFKLAHPGRFRVSGVIAAPESGSFEVSVAGQTLRCAAPRTGNYLTFTSVKLGVIELPAAGKAILAVRPVKEGWQPMNLKAIRLEPVPGGG